MIFLASCRDLVNSDGFKFLHLVVRVCTMDLKRCGRWSLVISGVRSMLTISKRNCTMTGLVTNLILLNFHNQGSV